MRAELDRVLASAAFAGAQAHQRLLRYLVEQTLAGQAQMLKETVLGIEVFMRPAGLFDPRRDSIVRVEARRLRERLRQHYAQSEGHGDLLIVLPKGSYRPQFVARLSDGAERLAAELIERGHFFLRQGHEDGHRKALERFEAAARTAPEHAGAHRGVARAWGQLVATNIEPPRPGIDHALAAVHRALAMQPASAESLVLAAMLTHRYEFDWVAARALYERALRAEPDSAFVRHAHAFSLLMRGDYDAAEADLAIARHLDPQHLGLRAHQALLHVYRREWDAAEDVLQALLDMSAHNVLGMSLLAAVALYRGDAAGALAQYRQVSQRHPTMSIGPAGEVQALAALGEVAAARAGLLALQQAWASRYFSPYQQAMAELRLNEPALALRLLERAVHEGDPNAICLVVDPAFDTLHGTPRFDALKQRVLGLTPGGVAPPAAAAASTP